MKLLSLVPLAAALVTTTAICQDVKPMALPLWTASLNQCPIGLAVKRGGLFAEHRVSVGVPLEGAVQRVELDFDNPGSRKIVKIGLTAYGFSNKRRTFTLGGAAPDLVRKVELTVDLEGKGRASSNLSLRDFTALGWFELNSMQYADGAMWTGGNNACRVVPNAMMLVSLSR